jgi:hypothetical protein
MESAQLVVALTDQAHTASARAQEIEKRAEVSDADAIADAVECLRSQTRQGV